MNLIVEFCIVFLICMAGEWIAALLPFTLPASVISLILLLILLLSGGVKERTIQGALLTEKLQCNPSMPARK